MTVLCTRLDILVWHIPSQTMWHQLKTIDRLDLSIAKALQNHPVKRLIIT